MIEGIGEILTRPFDWPGALAWLVVTVFAAFAAWVYTAVRYWRLAKEALHVPRVAPISVRGKTAEELGSREASLILVAQLAAITETFRRTKETGHTRHGEVAGLVIDLDTGADIPAVISFERLSKGPMSWEELVVRGIPIGAIVNLFMRLFGRIYIPYRRQYLNSLIHVSLVSFGRETQLIVSRGDQYTKSSSRRESEGGRSESSESAMFAKTAEVELLRDAAFMVHQLVHDQNAPGWNWLGMRYFVDGLEMLDKFHRTGKRELIDGAIKNFSRATEADAENDEALYIQGSLLLFQREEKSVAMALELLNRAFHTQKSDLRALVNAGLANCYAQQSFRLAKGEAAALARKHLELAEQDWKKAEQGWKRPHPARPHVHPRLLATRALVGIVSVPEPTVERLVEQFRKSLGLYVKASRIQRKNATYYNVLGWIKLKLADMYYKNKSEGKAIPRKIRPEKDGYLSQRAENYFRRSLEHDPTSTLTHANLCLLYANRHYQDKKYLGLCRHHGLRAIDLDPKYINGHRDLALSLLRYEEFKDACSYFNEALELARPNPGKCKELIGEAGKVLLEMEHSRDRKVSIEELKRWQRSFESLAVSRGQNNRVS